MTTKTWREIAHAVIQKALAEAEQQGLDADATKRYVNSKYPFGERAYHPYKMWLSEMQRTFKPVRRASSADLDKLQAWNDAAAKTREDAIAARAALIDAGQMEIEL